MASAEVVDAVDGIQAKRVHVIFGKPVQGVIDDEAADAVALRSVKVDGLSPGRVMSVGETGSKLGKIISFGAEVVVNHVQHNRQSVLVAGIDKLLQTGGTTVGRLGRVEAGAVVSPISISRDLRDRHDFNRGDAEIAKVGESRNDAFKGPFSGKRAGVEFVDDEILQRDSRPTLVGPAERRGINDAGRTVHAARLPARNRVRTFALAIEHVEIVRAGADLGNGRRKLRVGRLHHRNRTRVFSYVFGP